jgi:hypothetical protein
MNENNVCLKDYICEAISGKNSHTAYTNGAFKESSSINDVIDALEEIGITRIELDKKGYELVEELIKKSIRDNRRYYASSSTITIVVTSEIAYALIFLKKSKGIANIYKFEYDSDRDIAKVTGEYSMSPTIKWAIEDILSGLSKKFS